MTKKRYVRRLPGQTVYPVSFCPRTYGALRDGQEAIERAEGVTYSLSVIVRAMALRSEERGDFDGDPRLLELCHWCASKGKGRQAEEGE